MTDIPLELTASRVGDALVVAISGEIDLSNADGTRAAIDGHRDGASRVVVDLSGVEFLDSSALNALVHCQRDLAGHDVTFRVVSPAGCAARNVFEITNLIEPLGVVDSLDDALAT